MSPTVIVHARNPRDLKREAQRAARGARIEASRPYAQTAESVHALHGCLNDLRQSLLTMIREIDTCQDRLAHMTEVTP